MKTLFALIFLFTFSIASAQDFNLSTYAGSGVKFDKTNNIELYQTSISVIPQLEWDKFSVSGVSKSIFIDSTTELQGGAKFSYKVKSWDENKSLWISTHYLYGSDNAQILGGGVSYDVNALRLNIEGGYDTKSESKFLEFNVGLIIAQ